MSFHTVDLQNLVRGEETEEIPEAVEETEIVEEAATEETAEEVIEENRRNGICRAGNCGRNRRV